MEFDLPPDLEVKLARLVENGEFETKEDAVRQLLRTGLTAYQTQPDADETDPYEDEPLEDSPTYHDEDEYVF